MLVLVPRATTWGGFGLRNDEVIGNEKENLKK